MGGVTQLIAPSFATSLSPVSYGNTDTPASVAMNLTNLSTFLHCCCLCARLQSTVDKLIKKTNLALVVGSSSWREQFVSAVTVSAGESRSPEISHPFIPPWLHLWKTEPAAGSPAAPHQPHCFCLRCFVLVKRPEAPAWLEFLKSLISQIMNERGSKTTKWLCRI